MRACALAFVSLLACATSGLRAEGGALRYNGIEYMGLSEAAAQLGLRVERLSPAAAVMLKEGPRPVARLSDRSRETDIRGLRVFFGDPVIERSGGFYLSRTDYLTRLVPRLRPDLLGSPPREPRVIALDPGHGGLDHGTENRALGSMEKTYTLEVARSLKGLLEAAGYRVVLTRDSDTDVPLPVRTEIANRADADLLVSIHFNSLYPNTKTTGVEVLSFPPKSQRSTNSWSPGQKDDSESRDSPVNSFNAWNTVLAGAIHRHLLDTLRSGDRGEKFEHLGVLRGLKCPGVLVEPAFLSSDAEGTRLATAAYRDSIAAAILAGIQDYADLVRRSRPATVSAKPAAAPAPQPGVTGAAPRSLPTRPSPGT
jgi:N-acetylmuramoyl-L-alanine amidase